MLAVGRLRLERPRMHLDLPTVYVSLAACCLVLSLVWAMAARSFETLGAAKFWSAGMLFVATGAVLSVFRGQVHPLISILPVNGLFLLGVGCIWAGVRCYRGKVAPWVAFGIVFCAAMAGLALFSVWRDDIAMRVAIYGLAQSVLAAWVMLDLLSDPRDRFTPGVCMAAGACAAMVALNVTRSCLALLAIGGDVHFTALNPVQSVMIFLLAASGVLLCEFGFLLMAMDRLRKEMAAIAVTDELTGIANRRRFFEWARQECARSERTGRPFSLILIDIDRFKWINDTFGHAAGDEYLRLVARTMRDEMRAQDLFARLGGDEFCVLMPETEAGQAAVIGERLAAVFSGKSMACKGESVASTISVGVSEWTPAMGGDVLVALAIADRALYRCKATGRNGVTISARPVSEMQGEQAAA
jgi:diguanylate cyclase (GGDEF)-like protein